MKPTGSADALPLVGAGAGGDGTRRSLLPPPKPRKVAPAPSLPPRSSPSALPPPALDQGVTRPCAAPAALTTYVDVPTQPVSSVNPDKSAPNSESDSISPGSSQPSTDFDQTAAVSLGLPQIPSSRWALLALLSTSVVTLVALACFGSIEVTSIAPGALVVRNGPRPVSAQVAGVVAELNVKAGEAVVAGQQLARIDATDIRARASKGAAEVDKLGKSLRARLSSEEGLHRNMIAALARKRKLLAARSAIKRTLARQRREQAAHIGILAKEGAASRTDALAARETAQTLEEEALELDQAITDTDIDVSDRERSFTAEAQARRRELEAAESTLGEATDLTDLASVRAPVSGRVESLLVEPGQVTQAGAVIARVVPEGTATTAVAFAPLKDFGFLREGLTANVEFASLPVSEFGRATAKVTRVARDVASSTEVEVVLGAPLEQPMVRVELQLLPGANLARVSERLRAGEHVTVRLNTRRRRVITLFFDFLRKWFPQ